MQALLWKRCTTADLCTQTRARRSLHRASCAGFTPLCAFITSHFNSLLPVCPSCFPAPAAMTAHGPREHDRLLSTVQGVHRVCKLSAEYWIYPLFYLPTPAAQLFRMVGISHASLYVCLLPLSWLPLGIKLFHIILLASQFP